jgi:hypothetical protein
MPTYLEVNYRAIAHWAHPILNALNAKAALQEKHERWPDSRLSDLAFSIETRLVGLMEVSSLINEHLRTLADELERDPEVEAIIQGGYAYQFENGVAFRRLLVCLTYFISEARSCFENLANVNREFLRYYLGVEIPEAHRYEAIASLTDPSAWAETLRAVRHDLLHDRAPWLAFEVLTGESKKWEPVLLLNWRPGFYGPEDSVSFKGLRAIQRGLTQVAEAVRTQLILRVNSF